MPLARHTRSESRIHARRSSTRLGQNGSERDELLGLRDRPQGHVALAKLCAVPLLAGSMWMLLALFSNPRLVVSQVVVEGGRLVRPTDVERTLGVGGESIFRVQSRTLEEQLLAAYGCLEQVAVAPILPDRVVVRLREREAIAVWESGSQHWWVDPHGAVLGQAPDPGDLLVVHDLEGVAPQPKGHLVGVPWGLAHDLQVALPSVKAYDYVRDRGLVLSLPDRRSPTQRPVPVYLGTSGSAEAKVALLQALSAQLAAGQIAVEYIDLRNEQRPLFKRR